MAKAILKFNLDDFKDARKFDRAIKGDDFLECLNHVLDLACAFSTPLYTEMLVCANDASVINEVNIHHYDAWCDHIKGR
jgi:hypothetical protein